MLRFGFARKESSLRLTSVTLSQKIIDCGFKYTQEQFKRRILHKWIDGRGKRMVIWAQDQSSENKEIARKIEPSKIDYGR